MSSPAMLRLLCPYVLVALASLLSGGTLCVRASLPPATVSGSVNTIFLNTFQQAVYAYQLEQPTFSAKPLKFNSGFPGGLADAKSGVSAKRETNHNGHSLQRPQQQRTRSNRGVTVRISKGNGFGVTEATD
jgi:hypothetical protein